MYARGRRSEGLEATLRALDLARLEAPVDVELQVTMTQRLIADLKLRVPALTEACFAEGLELSDAPGAATSASQLRSRFVSALIYSGRLARAYKGLSDLKAHASVADGGPLHGDVLFAEGLLGSAQGRVADSILA